jgi:hypothetical protein
MLGGCKPLEIRGRLHSGETISINVGPLGEIDTDGELVKDSAPAAEIIEFWRSGLHPMADELGRLLPPSLMSAQPDSNGGEFRRSSYVQYEWYVTDERPEKPLVCTLNERAAYVFVAPSAHTCYSPVGERVAEAAARKSPAAPVASGMSAFKRLLATPSAAPADPTTPDVDVDDIDG